MKIHKLVPRGLLRSYILKSLKSEPKHGYKIMKLMEKETGWEPSPGAIYPTLHHLKKRGLITEAKTKNKKRISYKLTKEGRLLTNKIEKEKKELKKEIFDFIEVMSQIIDISQTELRSLLDMHKKIEGDDFFLVPDGIRKYLIKSKSLVLKLLKDKSKHKKLNKIIKENYKKLKNLESE